MSTPTAGDVDDARSVITFPTRLTLAQSRLAQRPHPSCGDSVTMAQIHFEPGCGTLPRRGEVW